jgi:AcrR family transcriptional regulator
MTTEIAAARRTSPELRRAIQQSQESVRTLCERHRVNPKTVRRWRSRGSVESRKTGPRGARSSVLSPGQEALIVAFREMTLLPLDDCLHALQAFIPDLTRASLHRCLRRHGISRLPQTPLGGEAAGAFDLHLLRLDEAEQGLCLFVAVERTSKFLFAELHAAPTAPGSADFLRRLAQAAQGSIRTVYTVPHRPVVEPEFASACATELIHNRRREPSWAREQLDALNALIRSAFGDQLAQSSLEQLRAQVGLFTARYNRDCRLKVLGGLAPQAYLEGRTLRPHVPAAARPNRARRSGPAARTPREGRDPQATREAILLSARALLARVGPEGVSLSQVARMSGVNRGTAYQHFRSRTELIAATAAWSSEQLTKAVFGDPPQPPEGPREPGRVAPVAGVAKRLANFAMRNPEMGQAWLLQMLSARDPSQDPFWRQYRGSGERFHQTAMAERDIDGEILAVTTLAGFFLWPIWVGARSRDEAELQELADRFARESLRYSMYGALNVEHFPDLAEELARPRG